MNFTKERGVYMVKKWIIRLIALLCVLSAAFLIADAISGPMNQISASFVTAYLCMRLAF